MYFLCLIFFSFIIFFCDACLPTPTVPSAPTIPIGPTNPCAGSFTSGPGFVITDETVDAAGVYTIGVDCTNMAIFLTVNGADVVSYPRTFSCNAATGKYTFLPGSGIPQDVNTLTC